MILVLIIYYLLIIVNCSYYQFSVNSDHGPIRVYDSIPPWQYFSIYQQQQLQSQPKAEHRRSDNVGGVLDIDNDQDQRNSALNELINKIKNRLDQNRGINRKYTYNNEAINADRYDNSLQGNQNSHKKWVSLEAVPWSIGTVSKWQQNTASVSPDSFKGESFNNNFHNDQQHKLQSIYSYDCNSNNDNNQKRKPIYSHPDSNLIITDNRPGSEFPSDNFSADRHDHFSHSTNNKYKPESPDGHWVLLSTNKGYQYPRPKNNDNPSVLSKRSVKMLVLPAVNEKDQMLSHNGLIEVARNKRTVEEDKIKRENDQKNAISFLKAYQSGLIPASISISLPFNISQRALQKY